MEKSEDIEVFVPQEKYQIIEFVRDNLPAIAVINKALTNENLKKVFFWNCSITLELKKVAENGMPAANELEIIENFEKFLDDKIKGEYKEKPNALFFGRETWNSTRQLIWKVYLPKRTNDILSDIIEKENYPREFDYRIEKDEDWEITKWYFEQIQN